ncbi:hypothetical protein BDW75DRAFT_225832 [Aspergillus navahoensis]
MPDNKKCIVVTGGASGLGLGTVRSFAEQGHHICVLDISEQGAVVETLSSEYPQASFTFHQANIADWDELAKVFEQIYSAQRRIDIVVANAGVSKETKITIEEDRPSKPRLPSLEINLIGTIYTVKLATHYMKKNKIVNGPGKFSRGSIICTASIAALYPFPVAPLYAASKHGVLGFVRSVAGQLEKEAIQINAVAPAFIKTNISNNASDQSVFDKMVMTPISTFTRAVRQVVADRVSSGQVVVAHGDNVTTIPSPPVVDEATSRNLEVLWSSGITPASA